MKRVQWTMGKAIIVAMMMVVAAACLGGCASVTAGGKMVNWQNKLAGDFIAAMATDPVLVQAGADVSENALVVADQIGKPEVLAAEYTAALSERLREQASAEKAQQRQLLQAGKTALDNHLPWASGALNLALLVGGVLFKKTYDTRIKAGIVALDEVKKVAVAGGIPPGSDAKTTINTIARGVQAAFGVWTDTAKDIAKFKSTGIIG